MSLEGQLLTPPLNVKYRKITTLLRDWYSGARFLSHGDSRFGVSIKDCVVGDRLIFCYTYPNLKGLYIYTHTLEHEKKALQMQR